MFKFSANTGFLWRDRPFLERIRLAAKHGFDGVEFHDEAQDTNLSELQDVLAKTGLPVISLNTRKGGTFGCAAIPSEAAQARREIDEAIRIAEAIHARNIHVLAGCCVEDQSSVNAFVSNLKYALEQTNANILIEPISPKAVGGYFLSNLKLTKLILKATDNPRLKIMFDLFHVKELSTRGLYDEFAELQEHVGHIQVSSYPGRNEPIDQIALLKKFHRNGYSSWLGCEFVPKTTVEAGLHWRDHLR